MQSSLFDILWFRCDQGTEALISDPQRFGVSTHEVIVTYVPHICEKLAAACSHKRANAFPFSLTPTNSELYR